jgi:hypothetical protein
MGTIARKTGNALVTGLCYGLGVIHFVTQTTADVASEAESKLIRNRDGVEPEHTRKERMYRTISRQQHILDKVQAFKDAVSFAKDKVAKSNTTFKLELSDEQSIANIHLVNAGTILSEQ